MSLTDAGLREGVVRNPTALLARITSAHADPVVSARALAVAGVLMIASSDFKFRERSAAAALQGSADKQVVIELGVYGVVGVWILMRRVLAESVPGRDSRRLARFSALRVARVFALAALVSSFWSPTSISTVRAVQYLIAVEVAAEVVYVCAGRHDASEAFWSTFSFAFIAATAAIVLLTLAPGLGFSPWSRTFQGVKRFKMLDMATIASADVLGLAALLALEPLARSRIVSWGGVPERPRWAGGRWALVVALVALVFITHERTSTIAGLMALAVFFVCARDRGRAQIAMVTVASAVTIGVAFFGSQLLALLLRGQTANVVASGSGRNQIFPVAWHLILARPFTGWGYLSGRSVYLPKIPWAGESHDALFEVAVSFGIVGLALFATLFARWWRLSRTGRRSLDDSRRLMAVRSSALLVLVVIVGVADDSFAGPPGTAVMALLLALALAELAAWPPGERQRLAQGVQVAPES